MTNPYQTPQAELATQDTLPESYISGTITVKKLGLAGWLAIVYLVISIPVIIVSGYAEYTQDDKLVDLSQVIQLVLTFVWAYLLFVLKTFLEARIPGFKFSLITYLAIVSAFFVTLLPMLFPEPDPDPENFLKLVLYFVLMLLPAGIINIIYGIKLVRIKISYPHIKVLGWLTIATGICLATVVLFIFAIPLAIISEVFLVLLFFHGKRELQEHGAS